MQGSLDSNNGDNSKVWSLCLWIVWNNSIISRLSLGWKRDLISFSLVNIMMVLLWPLSSCVGIKSNIHSPLKSQWRYKLNIYHNPLLLMCTYIILLLELVLVFDGAWSWPSIPVHSLPSSQNTLYWCSCKWYSRSEEHTGYCGAMY